MNAAKVTTAATTGLAAMANAFTARMYAALL
jgi:hypothetical protein